MSIQSRQHHSRNGHGTETVSRGKPKHSKEYALDEYEFELLLEGADRMDKHEDSRLEAKFAILVLGRLGLRVGELVHLENDWIDLDEKVVQIPRHEPCRMGRYGGLCGACRQHAEQRTECSQTGIIQARLDLLEDGFEPFHESLEPVWMMRSAHAAFLDGVIGNESLETDIEIALNDLEDVVHDPFHAYDRLTEAAGDLAREQTIPLGDAESMAWSGKTDAASRQIPFDWNPRLELWVERFCGKYEKGWPYTRSTVNRRLEWAQDAADGLDDLRIFPHALRATAATRHAANNIQSDTLQRIMGWACSEVSDRYILHSDERTAAILRDTYQR